MLGIEIEDEGGRSSKDRGRKQKKHLFKRKDAFGDSDRIQTCNLLIRSQMLYSVELRNPNYIK